MRLSHLITFLIILFIITIMPTGYTQSPNDYQQTEQKQESVLQDVFIETCVFPTVKVLTDRGRGSGTILNERYVLTACHVINNTTEVSIAIPPDMEEVRCKVIAHGDMEALDYAILELDPEANLSRGVIYPATQTPGNEEEVHLSHFANPITEEDFANLRTGEEVTAIGYPLGGELHATRGLLCSASNGFYSTSASVIYGNSGGGVYDSEYKLFGVVVRIAIAGFSPITHVNFVIPIDSIREDIAEKDMEYVWTGEEVPEETEPEVAPEEAEPEEDPEAEPEEDPEENFGEYILRIGDFETILLDRMFELSRR